MVFVEFFDVLFFNAVNDALYSDGSDCLLELEFFLESFISSWRVRISKGLDCSLILGLIMADLLRGANKEWMFLMTVAQSLLSRTRAKDPCRPPRG
jgi:hypothetical protein